jgi:midasin (ATPase involved in ribosome maturation)
MVFILNWNQIQKELKEILSGGCVLAQLFIARKVIELFQQIAKQRVCKRV